MFTYGAFAFLEELCFQGQVVWLGVRNWSVTHICLKREGGEEKGQQGRILQKGRGKESEQLTKDTSNGLALWQTIPVHCPRVPKDQVARINAHFDDLASSVNKPLDFFFFKAEPVSRSPWIVQKLVSVQSSGRVPKTGQRMETYRSSRLHLGAP